MGTDREMGGRWRKVGRVRRERGRWREGNRGGWGKTGRERQREIERERETEIDRHRQTDAGPKRRNLLFLHPMNHDGYIRAKTGTKTDSETFFSKADGS